MDKDLVLTKLLELEKEQKAIFSFLREMHDSLTVREDLDSLIDPLVLSKKLKISDRTLRRLKRTGILVPVALGSRDFYLESEVMKVMKDSRFPKK